MTGFHVTCSCPSTESLGQDETMGETVQVPCHQSHHLANFTWREKALGTNCTMQSPMVKKLEGSADWGCWGLRGAGEELVSVMSPVGEVRVQGLEFESQLHHLLSVNHWE